MDKIEIINKSLDEMKLQEISSLADNCMLEFPYNIIEDFEDESFIKLSNYDNFEWAATRTELIFEQGSNSYNLDDYKIDYKRIQFLYCQDGESIIYPKRYSRSYYKELFVDNPNITGIPQAWCLIGNVLKVYPYPDKDYKITIKHCRQIPFVVTDTDEVSFVPELEQKSFVNYIAQSLSFILGKSNANNFYSEEIRDYSKAKLKNKTFRNAKNFMRSNINWGL